MFDRSFDQGKPDTTYFSLQREIFKDPLFRKNPAMGWFFIWCHSQAMFRDYLAPTQFGYLPLKQGEFYKDTRTLAKELGIPRSTLQRWATKLEKTGHLTLKSGPKFTVISVHKYSAFRPEAEKSGPPNSENRVAQVEKVGLKEELREEELKELGAKVSVQGEGEGTSSQATPEATAVEVNVPVVGSEEEKVVLKATLEKLELEQTAAVGAVLAGQVEQRREGESRFDFHQRIRLGQESSGNSTSQVEGKMAGGGGRHFFEPEAYKNGATRTNRSTPTYHRSGNALESLQANLKRNDGGAWAKRCNRGW